MMTRLALRRLGPGRYATLDGRYEITRQSGSLTECNADHPTAGRFRRGPDGLCLGHAYYAPDVWTVWDTVAGDYVSDATSTADDLETRRDAIAVLARHLAK